MIRIQDKKERETLAIFPHYLLSEFCRVLLYTAEGVEWRVGVERPAVCAPKKHAGAGFADAGSGLPHFSKDFKPTLAHAP
jgi:hypothetical protein